MPYCVMLRRLALVRTDVSEECIASIIGVTRIGELETTLAVTSIRSTLLYDLGSNRMGYKNKRGGGVVVKRVVGVG
jgi:hypothetical protein